MGTARRDSSTPYEGLEEEGLLWKWGHDPPSLPWHPLAAPRAQESWDKGGTWGCRDPDGADKPTVPPLTPMSLRTHWDGGSATCRPCVPWAVPQRSGNPTQTLPLSPGRVPLCPGPTRGWFQLLPFPSTTKDHG